MKEFSTLQISQMIKVHPNPVRFYEKSKFITPVPCMEMDTVCNDEGI